MGVPDERERGSMKEKENKKEEEHVPPKIQLIESGIGLAGYKPFR